MTTGISLVRENAATMQPPRSLWVTFPLGRPLGAPNDAAFQHRVIAAALDLLTRVSGIPMLEARAEKRWGGDEEFRSYTRATSVLVPRPPRR